MSASPNVTMLTSVVYNTVRQLLSGEPERVAVALDDGENVKARMADHLRDEHGARARLRSLPPGEAVSGA